MVDLLGADDFFVPGAYDLPFAAAVGFFIPLEPDAESLAGVFGALKLLLPVLVSPSGVVGMGRR